MVEFAAHAETRSSRKTKRKVKKKARLHDGYTTDQEVEVLANIAGISRWSRPTKCHVAKLIMWCYLNRFSHKLIPSANVIESDEWGRLSSKQRMYLKGHKTTGVIGNVFDLVSPGYSQVDGLAMGWDLLPEIRQAIDCMDSLPTDSKRIDTNGSPVRNIKTLRGNGYLPNIPAWCPVNILALQAGIEAIKQWKGYYKNRAEKPEIYADMIKATSETRKVKNGKTLDDEMVKYLNQALQEMVSFVRLATADSHYGFIPVTYKQVTSGRKYAIGSVTP